ncbi:LytTR family DNA-binding domain-containing protein [Gymnodinialimonas ceratoperidinii]|uniref:LytTR family transcriptional regulator n=1 Tax=Gymnodinialimonas ceratoperidinii TaxID=2856823 RepID=A0A8F6TW81_9RHOB|nr:LytTR family DNA-binding domain-containing protein [Gymnodinialimonas ceratoperidinii]QXT39319.1 LytTR family transcriptional regulator [Gymnodinialimonas ceratoperidinii]
MSRAKGCEQGFRLIMLSKVTLAKNSKRMNAIGSGAPGTSPKDWEVRIGVAALASVLTALLGPFGTFEHYTLSERLLYWGSMIFGLLVPIFFIRLGVYRLFSGTLLRMDLLAVAFTALALGPLVWLVNFYVMGFRIGSLSAFFQHIALMGLVCLIPVLIRSYLRWSVTQFQRGTSEPVLASQPSGPLQVVPELTEPQTKFLDRLAPEQRGEVRRVSADDHQVDVWTDKGKAKVRLRFGDALAELADFKGLHIHRSHWVAFSRIDFIQQEGRRYTARLLCGATVPVSQNRLNELLDAGIRFQSPAQIAEHA